ncbi:MAG: stage II sporulation protein M, partial [Chloroflexi bacterium]|nr:stage II sporulation protein M [Chloroflexota bacterium]
DVSALARGYRRLAGDVAVAQRDFSRDMLTAQLNALAARAHMRVYQAPAGSWKRAAGFFAVGFPRRVRASWPFVALAAGLMLAPAIVACLACLISQEARDALVPAGMQEVLARGETWTNIEPAARPYMTTVLFTHNIEVSFLAFAGGLLAGLGSMLALTFNGLLLGALLGAAQHYGVLPLLGGFVSAHGWLELTSITIAGSAGLRVGWAELHPGLLRRRDALAKAGRQAVELVLGTLPVFVVAGLVEANVSPSSLPLWAKLVIGPALWVLLLAWLSLAGRRRR